MCLRLESEDSESINSIGIFELNKKNSYMIFPVWLSVSWSGLICMIDFRKSSWVQIKVIKGRRTFDETLIMFH